MNLVDIVYVRYAPNQEPEEFTYSCGMYELEKELAFLSIFENVKIVKVSLDGNIIGDVQMKYEKLSKELIAC